MRAIQITEFGGPEVLTPTELPDPEPRGGQVLIDVAAAGVNYADTHQAENSYLSPTSLPHVPGMEAVGRVSDGRRVVALLGGGGYAEKVLADSANVFEVPDGIDDGRVLALILQGTTAWHLLRTSARLEPGDAVVVHAAAGGVGSLAVQLAKISGAGRVIATASTAEKRELALSLGADAAVDTQAEDLTAVLQDANEGRQVDVVLEMTGGSVTDASLAALAPFGRLVYYGTAGRQPPSPVEPQRLLRTSRAVVGFSLVHCVRRPPMLTRALDDLFELTLAGKLRPVIGGEYPLAEARRAHEDLRARSTTGKLLLLP